MLISTWFEMTDDNPARLVDSSTCVNRLLFMLNSVIPELLVSEFQTELFIQKFPCSSKTNFSEMEDFRLSVQRAKKNISF